MVKTRIIKIQLVSSELEITKTKAKIAKGVQAKDILSAFHFVGRGDVFNPKTRTVLDKNTDIWDLIKDDKTPELYVCERTTPG